MGKLKTIFGIINVIKNYPLWFKNYFKLNKNQFSTYVLKNNLKIKIQSANFNIINHLINYDVYNMNLIKSTDIVVDIGAQVGTFSILASKIVEGQVYAFEPTNENFDILNENIIQNKITNITPIKKAIFSKSCEKKISICTCEGGAGSHSFYDETSEKTETVICTTLQDFMIRYNLEKIDFLKMDCEGSEYEILFNMPKDTLKKIKYISMEVHTIKEHKVTDLINFLKSQDYIVQVMKLYEEDTIVHAKRRLACEVEKPLEENYE